MQGGEQNNFLGATKRENKCVSKVGQRGQEQENERKTTEWKQTRED